jgi:hypothetical protein
VAIRSGGGQMESALLLATATRYTSPMNWIAGT